MRNKIAEERIKAQITQNVISSLQVQHQAIVDVLTSAPISLEDLRKLLMDEMGVVHEEALVKLVDTLNFDNIYDFSDWYVIHQMEFSELQRLALDTVLQTRRTIDAGCACKRTRREALAHEYFSAFWTNNIKTDLLSAIAKIAEASKVIIAGCYTYP